MAGWWPSFWSASYPLLPAAESRHLASMLWAAATAGKVPPFVWTQALLRSVGQPQRLDLLGPQALANILWALGRLGQLQALAEGSPQLLAPLLLRSEALAAGGSLDPQPLCMILWTTARLQSGGDVQPALSGPATDEPHGDLSREARLQLRRMKLAQLVQRVGGSLRAAFLTPGNLAAAAPRTLASGMAALAALGTLQRQKRGLRRGSRLAGDEGTEAFLLQAVEAAIPRSGVRELSLMLVSLARLGGLLAGSAKVLGLARTRVAELHGMTSDWEAHATGDQEGSVRLRSVRSQLAASVIQRRGRAVVVDASPPRGGEALLELISRLEDISTL